MSIRLLVRPSDTRRVDIFDQISAIIECGGSPSSVGSLASLGNVMKVVEVVVEV